MSRSSTLMLLGFGVMLIPFSGLPSSFRTVLTLVFGIAVVAFAVAMRARAVHSEKESRAIEPAKDAPAPAMSSM